jgi:polysaccharide deacetylase family protein (PEP-CTERM system associated)
MTARSSQHDTTAVPSLHFLSFDVEEWFHLHYPGAIADPEGWSKLPPRSEAYIDHILDLLDTHDVQATFFVVGWYAERHPDVVRRICAGGHSIGCHSYLHGRVSEMTAHSFGEDLKRSLDALSHLVGKRVDAYRAPAFSVPTSIDWFFDVLAENGITTDSSIFPARIPDGRSAPYPAVPFIVRTAAGDIREIPISTLSLFGRRLVISGGGYFRLTPLMVHRKYIRRMERAKQAVVTYLHARDFDSSVPLDGLSKLHRFMIRVGTRTTTRKVAALLSEFRWGPLEEVVAATDWSSAPVIDAS